MDKNGTWSQGELEDIEIESHLMDLSKKEWLSTEEMDKANVTGLVLSVS